MCVPVKLWTFASLQTTNRGPSSGDLLGPLSDILQIILKTCQKPSGEFPKTLADWGPDCVNVNVDGAAQRQARIGISMTQIHNTFHTTHLTYAKSD